MNIASWLFRAGLSHPGAPAVGQGTRIALSYGALAERAARLAGALHGLGLAPGDRVAIVAKNCVEYLELMFGIWHGGLRGGAGERQAARRASSATSSSIPAHASASRRPGSTRSFAPTRPRASSG